MPIYEYQCNTCGYIFDEVSLKMGPIKMSTVCPKCSKKGEESIATKLMSKGSFTVHGFNSSNGYSGNMR